MKTQRTSFLLAFFFAIGLLAGCGSGVAVSTSPPAPAPPTPTPPTPNMCRTSSGGKKTTAPTPNYPGSTFTGKVKAGALPVIGASVQVYAAGASGNGSAPTALLPAAVTTDAAGSFSASVAYTCPYNASVLYVVARGGKAGATGTPNSGTVLMTVLGPCNSISSTPSFTVDEATTVAGAFAMAQFLSAGGNIGGSSTNFSGLSLAAGTAANLANITTGFAPGSTFPSATGTAPTALTNALANLLNACIASSGASSSACTQLYSATSVSGAAPSNTLDAAMNIAKHPGSNVPTLLTLAAGSAAYGPVFTSAAPSDLTMFATYAGGGMNDPSAIAIDSTGNVWVANYFYIASLFSNTGNPVVPSGIPGNNLNNSYGMAVDSNDQAWIANEQSSFGLNNGLGTVTLLNSSGAGVATYASGGLNFPISVAIDTGATSWVVDYGNSHLTLLDASGTLLSGANGYTTDQFVFPVATAVDSKCYGYVANQSSNTVTKIPLDGSSFTSYVVGGGPSGVAVDGSDNLWVANYYGDTVGLVSSTGTVMSGGGYNGGGINHPQAIAIDGSGVAWVANYRGPAISQLAAASSSNPGAPLSPATGWGRDAQLLEAFGIAIDAAGNIWVSNFGSNTLTEFVGMAVPVKTPLVGPVRVP